VSPFAHERLGEYKPIPITLQRSAYYLRFRVVDRPGIIASLAGVLAEKRISLRAVLQLPSENRGDLPFVITVEPTSEQSIREALAKMSANDFLVEPPFAMPMERS
jgi:homoserine dehydrogenase